MSPRITRSYARQAATRGEHPQAESTPSLSHLPQSGADDTTASPEPSSHTRKRKSVQNDSKEASTTQYSSSRPPKRQKTRRSPAPSSVHVTTSPETRIRKKKKTATVMDDRSDPSVGNQASAESSHQNKPLRRSSRKRDAAISPPKCKSTRSENSHDDGENVVEAAKADGRSPTLGSRDNDVNCDNEEDDSNIAIGETKKGIDSSQPEEDSQNEDDNQDDDEEDDGDEDEDNEADDDDDPFGVFGGHGDVGSGLSNTLRALTGMMSGLSRRLRELLANLRQDDASIQVIALQELSEILLVSNEDNLSGHFSPDSFVKELVKLMAKEESPEIMLLACRCLANLMEALPASVANVVYGNAVPILCQKLLEISFIDLAEQALSTLEKISTEYPSSIVREGGLTACLSYLDFFATSTQRTAVTTAANCCRNISEKSFDVVRDVMPILLNVLSSSDQRVVEQACLCVSGIVESFKYRPSKLEELVSIDLLAAITRLLVPGTTNLIGPNIHTRFLRVLSFTARASPRLSAELIKLNVVETLYQILTGVSPPSGTEDVASKLDSVVVMQSLIHRPRDQIVETLNVICELLPTLPRSTTSPFGRATNLQLSANHDESSLTGTSSQHLTDKRVQLLEDCRDELRRFALIIFPTLTDAFSSTINLGVRQKVLIAQLKMLHNLEKGILVEALTPVPYASFLASILSQQDHPSLVVLGLQATELLLDRLDSIYRYQLYREGVILEIETIATRDISAPMSSADEQATNDKAGNSENAISTEARGSDDLDDDLDHHDGGSSAEGEGHDEDDGHHEVDMIEGDDETEFKQRPVQGDVSPVSSRGSTMSLDVRSDNQFGSDALSVKMRVRDAARRFLKRHDREDQDHTMKAKAKIILTDLVELAEGLLSFYSSHSSPSSGTKDGRELFVKLASYFDSNVLESVTSAEMLASGLVQTLLSVLNNRDEAQARSAQATFLEVFMGCADAKLKNATGEVFATPFSVIIHKLQELLSRSEHFEVLTVHHNSFDANRSSPASMLGKQIRLRLVADEESNIPKPYRNIMVSIHAIATFKSLDDYLRPRISMAERPRGSRRDGLSRALAAMAGVGGLGLTSGAGSHLMDRSMLHRQTGPSSGQMHPPASETSQTATSNVSSARDVRRKTKLPSHSHDAAVSNDDGAESSLADSRAQPTSHCGASSPGNVTADLLRDDADPGNTLECADEKQLTDDEDMSNSSALDAIVGELGGGVDDESAPDPSAVSFDIAHGNVTAHKDDGTRIATPTGQPSDDAKTASRQQATSPSTFPNKTLSYASALQTTPQDWHIEFDLDGKVVPNETTIYRAVHSSISADDQISRSIWSGTHSIRFRRVPGPPLHESPSLPGALNSNDETVDEVPPALSRHPITLSILQLLNILHGLNLNYEDVLSENRQALVGPNLEPLSQFVNTKLTAKLNRQLDEPLIVASSCLPSWSEDLARLYPFLFPFETRHLFIQSTSFGYARSMARWQNAQTQDENRLDRNNDRPFLGRLQRQKVRISRQKILESALKVMDLYGASQSILEVEYFDEVGTGLGPTLEFYSTVSNEFAKKKLKLWRDGDFTTSDAFVSTQSGLFPRPLSNDEIHAPNGERILHLFTILGKFVARSMIDSRIIDIHFNPIFFRTGDTSSGGVKPLLGAVKMVDPGLASSLQTIKKFAFAKKEIDEDISCSPAEKVSRMHNIVVDNVKIEDLCLDFTLPGYPSIELEDGGSQKRVDIHNVELYIEKVIDLTLGSGVRHQVDAFRKGFSQVFPYSALTAFTPGELVSLFGKVDEDWSLETLTDSIKADHGYNMDSRSVTNLLQTMSELDLFQRREFLRFITGSPKLPIGGFKNLTPMFTVVCKPSEPPFTSDDYLPSVMTCVNYLKLPNYTNIGIMKQQLFKAMKEGQGAFHLS